MKLLRYKENYNVSQNEKSKSTVYSLLIFFHMEHKRIRTTATKLGNLARLMKLNRVTPSYDYPKFCTAKKGTTHSRRGSEERLHRAGKKLTKRLGEQTASANQSHSFGFMHASRSFHSSVPSSGFCERNGMLDANFAEP